MSSALNRIVAGGAIFGALLTTSLEAVAAQDVPGFRPGHETDTLIPPLQPKSSTEISVPQGTGEKISPEMEAVKLTLSKVTVQDSSVYGDDDFRSLYQGRIGKEISLADVYRLAAEITVRYRKDGYVLSRAVVPAQRIKDGEVLITIVEGYIDEITIEGDAWIKGRVKTYVNKVLNKKPLNINDLERYLLLANDAAGVTAKSVIRPSPQNHGASHLTVVTDWKPVSASAAYDNYGTKYTGPWTKTVSASVNSISRLGERISVQEVQGQPLRAMRMRQLNATLPLGMDGTTLNFERSRAVSHPGFTLGLLRVKSLTDATSLSMGFQPIRSRSENFSLEFGIKHKTVETDALDQRLTNDRVALWFGKGNYDFADSWSGVNVISVTAAKGGVPLFDTTNKSSDSSRPEAGRGFYKLSFEGIRQQNILPDSLFGSVSLTLGVGGQFTSNKLPASEEYSLGGRNFGRGYDTGELTGDRALAGKVELTFDHQPDQWFLDRNQAYTFLDFGAIWNLDKTDKGTSRESRSLVSAGIGNRAKIQPWLSLDGEVAFPLTIAPATQSQKAYGDRKAPRFYIGVKVSY